MNNPIIEQLYDNTSASDILDIKDYRTASEERSRTHPYIGQLMQFEVKAKFMARMSDKMLEVYRKTNVFYKFLNAEIDTGDDLVLVRDEKGCRSEMYKIQIKPISYKAPYSKHKETWHVTTRRGHYAQEKKYNKYDFDYLITLDRDTEEFYIFDTKVLLSDNGHDLITKLRVKCPNSKSHFYKENWSVILPELKEIEHG